jgi:hypothetical protein
MEDEDGDGGVDGGVVEGEGFKLEHGVKAASVTLAGDDETRSIRSSLPLVPTTATRRSLPMRRKDSATETSCFVKSGSAEVSMKPFTRKPPRPLPVSTRARAAVFSVKPLTVTVVSPPLKRAMGRPSAS